MGVWEVEGDIKRPKTQYSAVFWTVVSHIWMAIVLLAHSFTLQVVPKTTISHVW